MEHIVQKTDFFHLLHFLILTNERPIQESCLESKIKLVPTPSLDFPVRDVQALLKKEDSLQLTCNFMGLYGVDSPLPAYFNHSCLQENEQAQAIRDFLDIFNHRSYFLYFLAWRAFQPEKGIEVNEFSFWECAQRILGEMSHTVRHDPCLWGRKDFYALLEQHGSFLWDKIAIYPRQPCWNRMDQKIYLGENTFFLGETTFLGEYFIECNKVIIKIGPLEEDKLQGNYRTDFTRVIKNILGDTIEVDIQFSVRSQPFYTILGQSVY